VAEQPVQDSPKRLPLLWVICVLYGLTGMLSLTAAFSMGPLGALICGGLAVADLAVAATLYLRLRAGWYAAMALLGFGLAWTVLSELIGGHPDWAGIAIRGAIGLGIAYYLYMRRRHFGRGAVPRPRIVSAPGIAALAIVVVLGGGLLLMTVDDARQSFPALEVQVAVPPEQENGFLLMEQMRAKWPLRDDEQLSKVLDDMPKGGAAPGAEWLKDARPLVQNHADCLAQARELVQKPHFVEVPRLRGLAWVDADRRWLSYTRALARLQVVSAEVQAADGHWGEALDEADGTVKLGVLVGKESTSLIQTLVGMAVTTIGLNTVRHVAATVPDAALLMPHLGPPLLEEELKRGFNLGWAGEFHGFTGVLEDIRKGGVEALGALDGGEGSEAPQFGLFGRHIRTIPLIKRNMTYNLFGRLMRPYVLQGDAYALPPANPLTEAPGVRGIARAVGWLHFARNPIGDIFIAMLMPAMERAEEAHFREVAGLRLTQLFIALRCYQLEHGRLPDSLDALAPQYLKVVPMDPFTGKPFGYEPTGKEPRIWSVGPNQRTDKSQTEGGDNDVVPLTFARD
jgi:hypothetical protein